MQNENERKERKKMKEQHQVLEGYIWWNNYHIPVKQFEQQLFGEEKEKKKSSLSPCPLKAIETLDRLKY